LLPQKVKNKWHAHRAHPPAHHSRHREDEK
jgi:hypothetical protein